MQISVIIPSYNRLALLPRAIDSVLQQTRKADEIIVIDDGSGDKTSTEIASRYPQIRLLQQSNQGVSSARNAGIRQASFEWIALLDSDDEWLPNKLEKQIEALTDNADFKFVHADEIWIRNGVRVNPMNKHKKYGGQIFLHCLPLCCISPSSVLLHRSMFDEFGLFDETLPACEDYDMWLKICSACPVLFLEEKLIIKHGGHKDQLSQRHWGMDRFRIQALDNLLSSNQLDMKQRKQTIDMLLNKINIFLNGARKRGNHQFTEQFSLISEKYSAMDTAIKSISRQGN